MAVLAAMAALAACSDADGHGAGGSGIVGEVTVFAAASLTDAYTEIGEAFTAAHPGATVTFNFASSSELAAQLVEGAPADVYASADATNMARITAAGAALGEPQVFATNRLEIIVEPGNPKGITGLGDLARPDLVYVTCAPEVPIGAYAAQALRAAGVAAKPASFEDNVKGVVTKVMLGEADAGIVYATDVRAAGAAAQGIAIPEALNVVASYPVVVAQDSPNRRGAPAFVQLVLSADGRAILSGHGFGPP